VVAVLDGIKKRAESGRSTIFIHTSGTSVLDDGSLGAFKSDRIYYDNDPVPIDAVSDNAPHRKIDLAIVRATKELGDRAKLAIMIPPTIYGFDQKHKRGSIQIPTITRFALKNGYAGHVGKGLSVESQVHFLDLARGYVVLLHHIESSPPSEVLENPYFFCENGKDFSFKEAAQEIGKALHAKGIINDATPREFKKADYDELFGEVTPAVIGLNARSRAVRLRGLGWEPKEKGIWESFNEDELPEILAEEK
jgi:nucleoside-diphosphate-sugar epimerase